jgi:integrase
MDEACKLDPASPRAAVKAGLAVALQVLLLAPMRIRNLARLDLERHMSRRGDGTWHLHIADSEVKNRVPLDYPLPGPPSELIDIYLREFRRRLARNGSTALFPGAKAGPKLETTLSEQITDLIVKQVGIRVTVHQFRHAAAAVILAANPGNYELVRRVLGHKNLTTTVRHYIGLETEAAVKLFQELVLTGGAKPAGDGA